MKDDYNKETLIAIYRFKNNNWEYIDSHSADILFICSVYPEKIDAPFPVSNEKYKYIKYDFNHDSINELIIPVTTGPNNFGAMVINLVNNKLNILEIISGFSYCIKVNKNNEYYLLGHPTGDTAWLYSKYDLFYSYKFEGNKLVKQEKLSDYIYNYILNKKISTFNNNKKEIYNFVSVFYFIYENRSKEDAKKWYLNNIKRFEYKEGDAEKDYTQQFFHEFKEKYIK
ncbi:MAG: hypothetical protein JXB50_06205 [Spirochaetes bacterium]|nr:hypothetical protein [Spirochaetota bacterium]